MKEATKRNRPVGWTVMLLSAVLVVSGYLLADPILKTIVRFSYVRLNINMGRWIIWHAVFACSIGLLPLWGWLVWRYTERKIPQLLVVSILRVFLLFVLCCLVAFVVWLPVAESGNPILNYSTPNKFFWNFVLIGSSLVAAIMNLIITRIYEIRFSKRPTDTQTLD